MITTVVFDLDDTLYDEIEYCKCGFTAVSKFLANLPEAPAAGMDMAKILPLVAGAALLFLNK